MGTLTPSGGQIKRGEFTIGYFDQHREMLDDTKSLMETFCPNGGDRILVRGRNMHVFGYLKNWLFPKAFLDKKIGVLSGGEKNRVALALLLSRGYDCLILDEPTNDLDIPTINILEEYLVSFQGALLFVSHDRYFVDKIAGKLFIFKGHGAVEESFESYSGYLDHESELAEVAAFEAALAKESATTRHTPPSKRATSKKLSYKEQRLYDNLPSEIETLEESVKALEACLTDPECYKEEGLSTLSARYEDQKALLEEKIEQFLTLEERVEQLQKE